MSASLELCMNFSLFALISSCVASGLYVLNLSSSADAISSICFFTSASPENPPFDIISAEKSSPSFFSVFAPSYSCSFSVCANFALAILTFSSRVCFLTSSLRAFIPFRDASPDSSAISFVFCETFSFASITSFCASI